MSGLESASFDGAIIVLAIGIIISIWTFISRKQAAPGTEPEKSSAKPRYPAVYATMAAFALVTLSIVSRAIITGHGPFSSMYEFALAFSWGIMGAALFFWWRYHAPALNFVGSIVAFGLLLFAQTLSSRVAPLVPALQQSALLTAHVSAAIVTYGAFTIGFGCAVLYLIQRDRKISWMPQQADLEKISYQSVMIGFPCMTLVIILGALWADIAWGSYWSWDPKETASLVTWLIYASYMHTRVVAHWKGNRSAWLLVIGFAAVLLTFFGNYIFQGLHSYG